MRWRRKTTFHKNPSCFLIEFNRKCFGEGGPNSMRILIDFYEKFNRKCVGGGGPNSIRILDGFK
jgi:hypothetical protein